MPEAFRHDFSAPAGNLATATETPRKPRRRRIAMRRLLLATGAAVLGFSAVLLLMGNSEEVAANATIPHEEWLHAAALKQVVLPSIRKEILQPGDTALGAFERLGYSAAEATAMIDASRHVYPLSSVRAGRSFSLVNDNGISSIYYDIDPTSRLHLFRASGQDSWQSEIEKRHIISRDVVASGTIEDSLFEAAAKAGLNDRTTMNLVDIFAWDIDFARDIRKGDSFRVLYEESFDSNGKSMGSEILAAEFVNQGRTFRAVRFVKPNGDAEYFTPDGKSMRKSYLKAPVKFTRISSRFTLRRMHPILGYTRAHKGVDYAAPTGTPISAVGDGRIIFYGWKRGYGRFAVIRHTNGTHTTAYGHMSRFVKGLHVGSRVRQGQTIGYVGMSGLATGPHLHFEFRVRGRAVNPLTIKRSPAAPVPTALMATFREQAAPRLARLNDSATLLAWD